MVPKGGKGKYNVTVPDPFNMTKRENNRAKRKTIRQEWLEDEEKSRVKKEERMLKK